ncbi:unnamed protein product [Phytophthora lilii]|uniref:Unnamed protein product n=1 Tax=Phytophthora lilii TaxID=2077276 RepID=A0A9W6U2X5_9STRA|nr:unnamed protein product [Phytophthora lilii]
MQIQVFEGESNKMSENQLPGKVDMDGLPLKPRGACEVTITVDVDANGTMNLIVTEISTGKTKTLLLDSDSLAQTEIERFRKRKVVYALDDKMQSN